MATGTAASMQASGCWSLGEPDQAVLDDRSVGVSAADGITELPERCLRRGSRVTVEAWST